MENNVKKFAGFTISPGEIGYSIGKKTGVSTEIIKCGVITFSDGAVHDKKGEHSACADRRMKRQIRRGYARKRLRKIETLRVLSSYGFCPEIPEEMLHEWRYGKLYPNVPELREWLATDIDENVNPYHDRYRCAMGKLDFSKREDRYCFGRAMYHLCQRRGYLSNAKDEKSNNTAGEVNKGISALTKAMEDANCPTLGVYFYRQMLKGERVRGCYTGREVHYSAEFNYICDRQGVNPELRQKLYRAIFIHRPLKSQKGNVGRCVFDTSKFRCQRSHPLFEEFRMWSFINNVKIRRKDDKDMRQLNSNEVDSIVHLFYRAKEFFKFDEIAKALAGKGASYGYVGERLDYDVEFNYPMTSRVNGNMTIHQIIAVLGKDIGADWRNWREVLSSRYVRARGRNIDDIVTDVWHVIMFFDDSAKLKEWFRTNLGVTDEKDLERVAMYAPDTEYASVSLSSVRKILPFLQQGYRYDESVFFANIRNVLPKGCAQSLVDAAYEGISSIMNDYDNSQQRYSKEELVIGFLRDLCPDVRVERLYHPSLIGKLNEASVDVNGAVVLGDVNRSIKNPVANRAEVQFRKLVNEMSRDGIIDRNTTIRVMVSTEMHGMNERRGIARWQKEREELRSKATSEIEAFFAEKGEKVIVSEDQINKWLLWDEQKHVCFYTGQQIGLADFLGPNARFDIEHTIPVSRNGDDSLMNKTLCDSIFNRDKKKTCLPCELDKDIFDGILDRIEGLGWNAELQRLQSDYDIAKERAKRSVEGKDALLSKAAYIKHRIDYLKGKIMRLKMTRVPENFAFRQDAIGKAVRNHVVAYLKTGYKYVFSESQETVRAFRKMWGLPSKFEYGRDVHRHNCIDAMVLSCLSMSMRNEWKRYWEIHDSYTWSRRPVFAKPWETFTEDVLEEQNEVIVRFEARDNFVRNRKHVVRDSRGKVVRNTDGDVLYQSSDCVGKSLHKDTYFSCRKDKDGKLSYGVRKPLAGMTAAMAEKIVDVGLKRSVLDVLSTVGPEGLNDFVYLGHKVRHVRISVRNKPYISLTRHRDCGKQEHKNYIYVENDSNYCVGLYGNGVTDIVSPLEALSRRRSGKSFVEPELNGEKLHAVLKSGTMVIFYEKEKSELREVDEKELSRRLYYLKGLTTSNGLPVLLFKHTAESRSDSACECHMGYWKNSDPYRPLVSTTTKKLNILVEGYDFKIDRQGNINWV